MKWKCTYTPEEEPAAAADLAALIRRHPEARVRRDKSKGPQRVVYVTIHNPKTLDPFPSVVV